MKKASKMKMVWYGFAAAAVLTVMICSFGAAFVYSGVYNVAATSPHGPLIYWLLQTTAVRSITSRARHIVVPDLSQSAVIARGFELFDQHCVQCHGAPGVAPNDFAKGFEPGAPPLAQTAREWPAQNMYYAIRNGIKMTAMPAWEYRMEEGDLWATVAFLRVLPALSPSEYRAMKQSPRPTRAYTAAVIADRSGDPERGRIAFHQYACNQCHQTAAKGGSQAIAGPALKGIRSQVYIAGVMVNDPTNMELWIRHPQSVNPLTAMPELGVTEQDARD